METIKSNSYRRLVQALLALAICILPACGGNDYAGLAATNSELPGAPRGDEGSGPSAAFEYANSSCNDGTAAFDIVGSGLNTPGLVMAVREAGDDGNAATISLDGDDARLLGVGEFNVSISLSALEVAAGDYDFVLFDTDENELSSIRAYVPETHAPCNETPAPHIVSVSHACNGTAGLQAVLHGQNLGVLARDQFQTEVIVGGAAGPEDVQNIPSTSFTTSWLASDHTIYLPVTTEGGARTYQINANGTYSNTVNVTQPTLAAMGCASGTNTGPVVIENIDYACAGRGMLALSIQGSGFAPQDANFANVELRIEYIQPYGQEATMTLGQMGGAVTSASDSEVVLNLPDQGEGTSYAAQLSLGHAGEFSNPFLSTRPADLPACQ